MGIEGNVYWIDGKRQTTKTVSAKEAFSDPEQAAAQVLYYEKHGSAEEKRLARLAYRQYQGKRYRKS